MRNVSDSAWGVERDAEEHVFREVVGIVNCKLTYIESD